MNEHKMTDTRSDAILPVAVEELLSRPSHQAVDMFRIIYEIEKSTGKSVPYSTIFTESNRRLRDEVHLHQLEKMGYVTTDLSKKPRYYITQLGRRFYVTLPKRFIDGRAV
jgi:predicted transcriptional regulator